MKTFNPGIEQTIHVPGDRAYRLGKLTLRVLRAFKAHCEQQVGDPFAHVEQWLGRVSEAETARQLKAAEDVRDQLRYFSLACPIARQTMATEEGSTKLLHLLMQEKDPKVTEEQAFALTLYLEQEGRLAAALAAAQGGGGPGEGNAPPPEAGQESAGVM